MPLLKSLLLDNIIHIHIWKIDESLFILKKLVSLSREQKKAFQTRRSLTKKKTVFSLSKANGNIFYQ